MRGEITIFCLSCYCCNDLASFFSSVQNFSGEPPHCFMPLFLLWRILSLSTISLFLFHWGTTCSAKKITSGYSWWIADSIRLTWDCTRLLLVLWATKICTKIVILVGFIFKKNNPLCFICEGKNTHYLILLPPDHIEISQAFFVI